MRKYSIILLIIGITPVVSGQEADSLNHYLETAAQNNPAVIAAFHSYQAVLQTIPQMGALEDPQLETGFFLKPMETLDGRQIAEFKLMQMFPWFGTRKAARREAQHTAKMAFEQFREAKDNLYLELYTQWYVLNRLQQRLKNSRENMELLKQLEALAIRKFSAGNISSGGSNPASNQTAMKTPTEKVQPGGGMPGMGGGNATVSQTQQASNSMPAMNSSGSNMTMPSSSGGMSDVLRIQLEVAELENNVESILSEIAAEKARFNALLNRPAASEIVIPDDFEQTPYLLHIEPVMQLVGEQNPMLGMFREESLAYEAKTEMAKKMGYPMFGIGLQYMLIGKTPGSAPAPDMSGMENTTAMNGMNGKDMFMPMVSVTIPIYRGKYKAAQKEAQFRRQAAQAKFNDARNQLEAELYRYKQQLGDAARKITLYRKQAELARTTCELLIQEFVSGKNDLSSIVQVQRQLLDYRLKESEAIADYNTMVANIQKIISTKKIEQ